MTRAWLDPRFTPAERMAGTCLTLLIWMLSAASLCGLAVWCA